MRFWKFVDDESHRLRLRTLQDAFDQGPKVRERHRQTGYAQRIRIKPQEGIDIAFFGFVGIHKEIQKGSTPVRLIESFMDEARLSNAATARNHNHLTWTGPGDLLVTAQERRLVLAPVKLHCPHSSGKSRA